MAKKPAEQLPDVFQEIAEEAKNLLSNHVPTPDRQLMLFEEYADSNEELKQKNPKTKEGLTWAQEVFCQLWARGYSKVEAYRLSHPNCKTENLNNVYPKASRLSKMGKIGARKDAIEKQLADRALMSPTEVFQRLTAIARDGGKDALDALKQIAQIHGLFKQDNNPASQQVIVQRIDFANAYSSTEQAADGQNREVEKTK